MSRKFGVFYDAGKLVQELMTGYQEDRFGGACAGI
jgi:hypothetical protein